MGLDMYLSARKYISGVDWKETGEGYEKVPVPKFDEVLSTVELTREDVREDLPSAQIELTVAYWRKVNSVHQWFVDNCANGEDDCRPVYVPRECLEELLATVEKALTERDSDYIPPQGGFFFGSIEVDDYYWSDLEETKTKLKAILENPKLADWDFEYQASW